MMLADHPTDDTGADERVSTEVISAVAAANDVDPLALDTPLFEVVDPDALDALFRSRDADAPGGRIGRVTFTMEGCEVEVDSDGTVTATPLTPDSEQRGADTQRTG